MLPDLTDRATLAEHELLSFPDVQTLKALDIIIRRRPAAVTLERSFANSPRGTALIKRIKADPSLNAAAIHIVDANGAAPPQAAAPPSSAAPPATPDAATPGVALDPSGTRRASRLNAESAPEVLVDGNATSLVDLSPIGAQILSPNVLKPNQRVRVTLSDAQGTVRVNGLIIWASFEIPPQAGPRYRAGIEFAADPQTAQAVGGFCRRHTK